MLKKNYLLLLLLFSSSLFAQNDKLFKSFAIDNPMSYQFVMSIAQDKHDFMWFGAQEGLHRFDGYQLVSFHHDVSKPNSLSSNVISSILTDDKDKLWVGTRGGGVNLYQENTQDFIHITSKSENIALTNDSINALFSDSRGNLWVGTENGLNLIDLQDKTWKTKKIFQELTNPNSLSHNTVHSITESNDNHIWVGTNGGGISVFDLHGNFIKTVKYGDGFQNITKFINALFTDDLGNIWIGTVDNGLLRYNDNTSTFTHYRFDSIDNTALSSNTIHNIYQGVGEDIWIATDNGLSIYHYNNDSFSRYNHAPNNPYSLSNDYIINFFEDKNKIMWIGTFSGIHRWDPAMTTFSQITRNKNPELISRNITSFVQVDNEFTLFSTYSGGIYQLSLDDNQIMRLDFDDFFADLRIMTLFADGDDLWVGTRASGLFHVSLTNKKITPYKHDATDINSISADSVTDIIKSKSGQLWISTFYQGLNRLNKDGTFTRFTQNKEKPELGPSNNLILHLLEDEEGIIWIATYGGGLNRFNPQTKFFTHIMNEEHDTNSLSSNLSWFLLIDNEKNLWISTQAAGLNVLSYQNRLNDNFEFMHFDTRSGMKSQTIYGMVQDDFGDIWLSSNKGVSRYFPEKNSFKHFDLSHGLVDLDYNHGSIFKGLDNTIYFGSGKGFSSVKPESSHANSLAPKVRLTNIFKLNEAMLFNSPLADLPVLELDHTDQLVSFEYVGLNYANPTSTLYQYRLLGFEQEWIDAGNSRRATYTNLPAGHYQLQVIAGNSDNVWSEPGLSLDIIVKPAPWNTWWAYLIYTISVAFILLIYSRFLNRKLVIEQQQQIHLKQQIEEKTKDYFQKNIELKQANKQLENAATVDKVTGVKSRRYLDIYIEQASQLMSQIHENILPVQRNILPRLYLMMVKIEGISQVTNSQLIDLTDLLLYSSNKDDLIIRWSEDVFAVIGYEKDDNVRELASRLVKRFPQVFGDTAKTGMAYAFYPFNFEQPMALSWDQVSVITEHTLKVARNNNMDWLGVYAPKVQPFSYLDVIQQENVGELSKLVKLKNG